MALTKGERSEEFDTTMIPKPKKNTQIPEDWCMRFPLTDVNNEVAKVESY